MDPKVSQNTKTILENKKKARGFIVSHLKIYNKTIMIKTKYHGTAKKQNQGRMERNRVCGYITGMFSSLIFDKVGKIFHW